MSDLFDCKTNEFDCMNSHYAHSVINIIDFCIIQRDNFREWLKKERLKTEKSQRKKGNSGRPPQNQRETSRDLNSKRPRVKEIFK